MHLDHSLLEEIKLSDVNHVLVLSYYLLQSLGIDRARQQAIYHSEGRRRRTAVAAGRCRGKRIGVMDLGVRQ